MLAKLDTYKEHVYTNVSFAATFLDPRFKDQILPPSLSNNNFISTLKNEYESLLHEPQQVNVDHEQVLTALERAAELFRGNINRVNYSSSEWEQI
ncbi:hypothetical protein RCL1_007541 [Eukaryota sp. TZLM3-RCL]